MESTPKISVIVPIYQVEPYLRQCVDSILAQTYTNLEVILVDDGSPDGCPAICDAYAAQDSRVRVIHKPNGGVSSARNAGLDAATGELIGFTDPDDWIREDMFEKMYDAMCKYGTNVAVCAFDRFFTDGHREAIHINWPEDIICNSDIVGSLVSHTSEHPKAELWSAVWNKLFTRQCFDGLRFDTDMKVGEDCWVWIQISTNLEECALCDETLYTYRENQGGAIATIRYLDHSCLAYETAKKILSLWKNRMPHRKFALECLTARFFIAANFLALYDEKEKYLAMRKDYLSYEEMWREYQAGYYLKYRGAIYLLKKHPTLLWKLNKIRMKRVEG